MVRRNDPTIDEEALRQAIGRQSSHGSVLRTPEDPTTDDEPAPPPEAAASEACEPRRRRLRMPDFVELTTLLGKKRLKYHLTNKAYLLPPNMRTIV